MSLTPKRVGLGISIEHDRIIALQADISPKGVLVEVVDEQILPPGALAEGVVKDLAGVVDSFRELKKRAKLSAEGAAINLPGHFYTLKKFETPPGYFSNENGNLDWEMQQHLTGSISDYCISHVVAGQGEKGENNVVVAARLAPLDERAGLLLNFGLSVYAVEPGILSINNGLAAAFGDLPDERVLLVDISAPYCTFALLINGVFMPGGVFYTPHDLVSGHPENAIQELAQDLEASFNSFYAIEGYSMTGRRPGLMVVAGRFADANVADKLAAVSGIPVFKGDLFAGGLVKSKLKNTGIPWQRLVKPLGLALRAPNV
ncbi:hypothetical protein DRQ36_11025 [bacterium]|nr:MAG: hypothetical protein DRQ36_11025 [bacterium]